MRAVRLWAAAAVFAASTAMGEEVGAGGKAMLPFIEDDYPKAMAEARAKKLPVFVEAWAPW